MLCYVCLGAYCGRRSAGGDGGSSCARPLGVREDAGRRPPLRCTPAPARSRRERDAGARDGAWLAVCRRRLVASSGVLPVCRPRSVRMPTRIRLNVTYDTIHKIFHYSPPHLRVISYNANEKQKAERYKSNTRLVLSSRLARVVRVRPCLARLHYQVVGVSPSRTAYLRCSLSTNRASPHAAPWSMPYHENLE